MASRSIWQRMALTWELYVMLLPTLAYFAIFQYVPMYGLQIAFKDYVPTHGFAGSEWVGLKHFIKFFDSYMFWDILWNTVSLSIYELATFPIAVILALLLNQLTSSRFKRVVQTVTFAPHFISTVVLVGMLYLFLSPRSGFANRLIESFGGQAIYFLGEPGWFKSIFVWSGVWQNVGWGMILYLAALTAIHPEQHEAAVMDGANKLQRIRHIDLPGILPTIMVLLLLNIGNLMSVGFEKAYLLQNSLNASSAEIIQTYVYKNGLAGGKFSYAAAIGFFNSVVNFILLLSMNTIARRSKQTSLW